jgi:hypothetical protein
VSAGKSSSSVAVSLLTLVLVRSSVTVIRRASSVCLPRTDPPTRVNSSPPG